MTTAALKWLTECGLTAPDPGEDPGFDALRDLLARTDYRPAGVPWPALMVPGRASDGSLHVVFVQYVPGTAGDGYRFQGQCLPVDRDPHDASAVLLWLATFIAWVATHEALERFTIDDGTVIYDPHQGGDDSGQPVVHLPGKVTLTGLVPMRLAS